MSVTANGRVWQPQEGHREACRVSPTVVVLRHKLVGIGRAKQYRYQIALWDSSDWRVLPGVFATSSHVFRIARRFSRARGERVEC